MSPLILACPICGQDICNEDEPDQPVWLNQFRMLYTGPDGIAVSGVGFFDDPGESNFSAPLTMSARWDDEDCVLFQFGVDFFGQTPQPIDGRWGFPFHEACWSLLEKAYAPASVPCETLFEVCSSLPFPSNTNGISWGHDYGGLVSLDDDTLHPWEDRVTALEDDDAPVLEHATRDPYTIPKIQELPHEDAAQPPSDEGLPVVQKTADCFSVLPGEIIVAIAMILPTADVLNARLASASFLPVFDIQQFWASRFGAGSERSWLFESTTWDRTCDWRWIYRQTNYASRSEAMHNRERVWSLIRGIQGTLRRRWVGSLEGSLNPQTGSDQRSLIPSQWPNAFGKPPDSILLDDTYRLFHEGCLVTRCQTVRLPPGQLRQMVFSILPVGYAKYIAGIKFILDQDEAINFGYETEEQDILDITNLSGFILAVGSRGVQGIRCIAENGRELRWVGYPQNAPKTRRLVVGEPVMELKGGFDGCKMVGLAVPDIASAPTQSRSLRESAFWYPDVPNADLDLNEDFVTGRDALATEYNPLLCVMFGGPRGTHLRSLIGISVKHSCIGFRYNREDGIALENRQLGKDVGGPEPEKFEIDGPGGEVINSISMHIAMDPTQADIWYFKTGRLISLKISTNRGRSCQYPRGFDAEGWTRRARRSMRSIEVVEKTVTVAPGSTIIGLYGFQQIGLQVIGVISQVIPELQGEQ